MADDYKMTCPNCGIEIQPEQVEQGVLHDLKNMNVPEPVTAAQLLALSLARRIDAGVEEKSLAALSRELRLTLDQVRAEPTGGDDDRVERLQNKD